MRARREVRQGDAARFTRVKHGANLAQLSSLCYGIKVRSLLAVLILALAAGSVTAAGWPQPAISQGDSRDIEVLFTFDDGPSPLLTAKLLDTLKEHHVQAIFFLVGNMAQSKDKRTAPVLERMKAEGHVLANHTQNHLDLCRNTLEKSAADIDNGKATIERVTGWPLAWIRIPFGARCAQVDQLLADRGLWHFHWDLDPQEWQHHNADKAFTYVTGQLARARGRVVLLMHDIQPATIGALPRILTWIDEENARRATSKKKQIKILQAPAYAAEKLPNGLGGWLREAGEGIKSLPDLVARVLP